jgi:hypothetical protein
MLLLSLTVGTWVKAPGLKDAGRIVGFVAGDDGQWRMSSPTALRAARAN